MIYCASHLCRLIKMNITLGHLVKIYSAHSEKKDNKVPLHFYPVYLVYMMYWSSTYDSCCYHSWVLKTFSYFLDMFGQIKVRQSDDQQYDMQSVHISIYNNLLITLKWKNLHIQLKVHNRPVCEAITHWKWQTAVQYWQAGGAWLKWCAVSVLYRVTFH